MNMKKTIQREMMNGKEFFRIGEGGRIIVMTAEELAFWEKEQYRLHLDNNGGMSYGEFKVLNMENYGRLSALARAFGPNLPVQGSPCDTLVVLMADEKEKRAICFGDAGEIRSLAVEGSLAIVDSLINAPPGQRKIQLFKRREDPPK